MPIVELNDNQKAAYIEGQGARCLICNSKDLDGERYEGEGNVITQPIACLECGSRWQDVYVLTDVDSIETERWTPFVGQVCGLVKVGLRFPVSFYAA